MWNVRKNYWLDADIIFVSFKFEIVYELIHSTNKPRSKQANQEEEKIRIFPIQSNKPTIN